MGTRDSGFGIRDSGFGTRDLGASASAIRWIGGLALLIVVLAGTVITPAGVGAAGAPLSLETTAISPRAEVHSRADETRSEIGPSPSSDQPFFTRLAMFLACAHDWFAALGGLLGSGDAFSRIVTVSHTCHPGPGLYELGRWIAADSRVLTGY
ncbi:MAG TPA: hypothetical protein VH702_16435 [Vicinamibacterales bacterium]